MANLSSVRAGNSGSLSTIESARSNLTEVTNEQNQLVKSAESALLSTDLQAYPNDASRNVAQPTVTGSYTSSQEGSYVLNFYRSGANSGYSARFTGLENGTVSFPDNGLPVRLGSRGLFVAVPEDTTGYSTTDFTISIPNTRSSSYQSLLSKLETAKSTRERLITSAQAELDRLLAQETGNNSATTAEERRALAGVDSARAGVAAANASLSQANAGVKIAQSQLEDKVLRSPFAGTIARSDLQVGESVTSNQVVATIVSEGDFEIELQVPEIDVARLEEGMTATITLDAYGAAKKWQGEIIAIESIETVVEGVPVYITTVKILDPTSEIKIGMNARASIELDRFENVIAVPQSYILEDDGRNYVLVRSESSNDVIEKTVELGLRGADSLVQIVSGLEVGEIIVREETSNE